MSTERKTRETRRVLRILLWHIAVLGVAIPGAAHQAGEKALTESIRSLQAGAKAFRVRFEQAIRKSKVGNTIRGQNTRRLVRRFEWQTQAMRENFERTQEAGDVAPLFNTANRITAVVYGLRLGDQTERDWENLRADLARVTNAAGVVPPADASCEQAIGIENARELVKECIQVSPATHPPCNVRNSCELIIDEIKRGCGLLTSRAPMFCREYR